MSRERPRELLGYVLAARRRRILIADDSITSRTL